MNVVEALSKGAQKMGNVVSKESPTILTWLGISGVPTVAYMAAKATPVALDIIAEEKRRRFAEQDEFAVDLTPIEIVKMTWKCYVPTAAAAGISMLCIFGANHVNLRRNAALVSLYSITEGALREYQAKVVKTLGEKKEEKLREEIMEDRLKGNPVQNNTIILTSRGDMLCYDSLSGRYFKSDIETIRQMQNEFNRELLTEMYKTLNDFYDAIGLEGTEMGKDTGWNVDTGMLDVHFTAKIATDDQPCIVLEYRVTPRKL